MPLIPREDHEALLEELLNTEIERSRLTDILQELRTQHNSGLEDVVTFTSQADKLQKDNNDLIVSNSKLFRQVGIVNNVDNTKKEEKEFSETVTLEELESEI